VPASRWKTCYSTTSAAATAAAAAAAAGKRHWSQPAPTPRWFGFDAETCGTDKFRQTFQHEVIAVAAYDLDSGDAYTALINPALHNPRYKYREEREAYHGESAVLA
jgi:hypothetical protein